MNFYIAITKIILIFFILRDLLLISLFTVSFLIS